MPKNQHELIAMCIIDADYTPIKTVTLNRAEQQIKNYAYGLNGSPLRIRTPKEIQKVNPTAFIRPLYLN